MTNKRQERVTIGFSLLRSYKQAPPVYRKTPNDLCSNAYVMMLISLLSCVLAKLGSQLFLVDVR